jgi:hypothetical protein
VKGLPLTVLLHEGPIARAYLAALRSLDLRPERILLLVYDRHPSSGKPVGRFLPRRWRRRYAEAVQERAFFHWPRFLRATRPGLCQAMAERVGETLEVPSEIFDELTGRTPLEELAGRVDRVLVSGLQDEALTRALSSSEETAVLFTGGGLLRPNLLGLPGTRFLHVHPGLLPHVRGADGLLWSMLVRGRPGASCFYMEAGLDAGEVVAAEELPVTTFPRLLAEGLDDRMLYRAVFSFYDPVLRARLLTKVMASGEDPLRLPSHPQDLRLGLTYHFMHPALRRAALETIFC